LSIVSSQLNPAFRKRRQLATFPKKLLQDFR
jgi:hypothetical protein